MNSKEENGHATRRAVLYIRVSTEEQAKEGYSIPDQRRTLREHAGRKGYEVVEEVVDDGYSGAFDGRPGLRRVLELAEAGAIDLVLAIKRNRYFRSRFHRLLWDRDLQELGVTLVSLDDTGNRFGDAMNDEFSEWYREEVAENTRRGRLEKARSGKVVSPRAAPYGFSPDGDGYAVDEEKMFVVRRIFDMMAGGASLYAVKRALENEGVPAPRGGREWNTTTLRKLILSDRYFPFTHEEAHEATGGPVDPDKSYGLWWYNVRRTKTTKMVMTPDGSYKKRRTYEYNPEEDRVAVALPDAGIPREVAEAAREAIKYNRRTKKTDRRHWELSGGFTYCGECGRRMTGHSKTSNKQKTTRRFYYVCPRKHQEGTCLNSYHRAEKLEERVHEAVMHLLGDLNAIEEQIEERICQERTRDPKKEVLMWTKRIEDITTRRSNYQDQQAAGAMTIPELKDKLASLDMEKRTAEQALDAARDRQGRIAALENERAIVLAMYAGYASADLKLFPPEERQRIYRLLALKATVYKDGQLEVEVAGGNYFPDAEEAYKLVESIIFNPERQKARQQRVASMDEKLRRAGLEHVIPNNRRVPTKTAS